MRREFPHRYNTPVIDPTVWIAPGAQVMGDVHLGAQTNIWFNAVIRGDVNFIRIGSRTNIQDLAMVHVSHGTFPTVIGDEVTVGHGAILHACTIQSNTLIGMGSVILDGAEIGEYVLLGAGSLVTEGAKIPSGSKAFGRPAKVVGQLSKEERAYMHESAARYVRLMQSYRN